MNTRLLEYFLTVAEKGNITRAAEILHITQPTLSRQLMELEQELGTQLLIRGNREVYLTDSGRLFRQHAMEILTSLDKFRKETEPSDTVSGTVSIAMPESGIAEEITKLIVEFTEKYPAVKFDLYGGSSTDIRNKLDRNEYDIGILLEPVETTMYDPVRLPVYDTWGILTADTEDFQNMESVALSDLEKYRLIMPKRQLVLDTFSNLPGVDLKKLQILCHSNLISNCYPLVKKGLAVCVTISGAASLRREKGIKFIPFAPEWKSGHVLVCKKDRVRSTATELFLSEIKKQLAEQPQKLKQEDKSNAKTMG